MKLIHALLFVFLFTLFGSIHCNASNGQVGGDTLVHNLLSEQFNSLPIGGYYFFLINPGVTSVSNANVIYEAYTDINEHSACKSIYYVMLPFGVSDETVERYFEEVLKIKYHPEHVHLDKQLYDTIFEINKKSSSLSALGYVYYKQQQFFQHVKFTGNKKYFTNNSCNYLEVIADSKVKVDLSKYLHSPVNSFYPLKDQKTIQISDINQRVGILNLTTGKLDHVLDMSSLIAIDLYKKHVNPSTEDLATAKENSSYFKAINRPDILFYGAFANSSNIYLTMGGIVVEASKITEYLDGGTGELNEYPAGTLMAHPYYYLIKTDFELKIEEVYLVPFLKGEENQFFSSNLSHFHIVEDTLYMTLSLKKSAANDFEQSRFYNKGIAKYHIDEELQQVVFDGIMAVPMRRDFMQKLHYSNKAWWFNIGDKIYLHYNFDPGIYSLDEGVQVATLSGTGQPDVEEYYHKSAIDTFEASIAWSTKSINKVGRLIIAIYQHNNQYLLELFNEDFNSLQVFSVNELFHLVGARSLIISDGYLSFFTVAGPDIYIENYRLQLLSDQ